jgi:hypothetical protein
MKKSPLGGLLFVGIFYSLSRKSKTRLALPCERSIDRGSTRRTLLETPRNSLIVF